LYLSIHFVSFTSCHNHIAQGKRQLAFCKWHTFCWLRGLQSMRHFWSPGNTLSHIIGEKLLLHFEMDRLHDLKFYQDKLT
jgi:hypothetical protein